MEENFSKSYSETDDSSDKSEKSKKTKDSPEKIDFSSNIEEILSNGEILSHEWTIWSSKENYIESLTEISKFKTMKVKASFFPILFFL